ncbi:Uncharacterised protein [Mycolicibacterium thermoresistibile]|nr:Uncharacterised protein [Mycolicibacterium thermoresistibile]
MGELYYHPYDFDIDDDPYRVWRRMTGASFPPHLIG